MLPNFGFVAGDFQPHPDLDIPKLSHELVLLRILAQPSIREGRYEEKTQQPSVGLTEGRRWCWGRCNWYSHTCMMQE